MKNKHLYSPDWRDIIRPAALAAAGYKCQNPTCKIKHKQIGYYDHLGTWVPCDDFMVNWAKANNFKIQKIYLQVAHLDQNPSNNSPANLRAFCPAHHFEYDRYYNNFKKSRNIKFK